MGDNGLTSYPRTTEHKVMALLEKGFPPTSIEKKKLVKDKKDPHKYVLNVDDKYRRRLRYREHVLDYYVAILNNGSSEEEKELAQVFFDKLMEKPVHFFKKDEIGWIENQVKRERLREKRRTPKKYVRG